MNIVTHYITCALRYLLRLTQGHGHDATFFVRGEI